MFRKFILTIFLSSSLAAFSFAQGGVEGGLYANYFQLGYRGQTSFGGQLHIPIGDVFTLNYRLSLGPSNGGLYVHAPAGAVAGGWLISNFNESELLGAIGFLMFAVPEGVGGYIKSEGKFRPYVSLNPLGIEYWHKKDPYEEFAKMSCNATFRMKMTTGVSWLHYIAPEVSATYIYTPGTLTERIGFHIGITFGYQSEETW